jgi:hypothetical protein
MRFKDVLQIYETSHSAETSINELVCEWTFNSLQNVNTKLYELSNFEIFHTPIVT